MRVGSFRWARVVNPPDPAVEYAAALIAISGLGMLLLVTVAAALGRSLSPLTWYLARASGMTLYLLIWLSSLLGLGLTTALLDRLGGRAMIYSIYAFTTLLAYGFLALHLISLAADPTVTFGLRDLLVPFAASLREPWTGFGVLAAELTVIVGVSFGVRRLTGYRAWRFLHWLTFPLFALALAHGAGSGSDSGQMWAQALYVVTGASTVALFLVRIARGPRLPRLIETPQAPPLDRLARLTPARPRTSRPPAQTTGDGSLSSG